MTTKMIPVRAIRPHPKNPRFDLGDISDLTADVRDNGLIEPLVVVPGSYGKVNGLCGDCDQRVPRLTSGVLAEHIADGIPCPGGSDLAADEWFVVAGHRRRAACESAGVAEVECVTRFDLRSTADQIALMMRENGHRRDLTPLEEAHGYEQLVLEGLTATRIAQQVKRSKKTVDRRLALLNLSSVQQRRLRQGQMTLDEAEQILDLTPEQQDKVLRSVGTKTFREDIARERTGSDDRVVIASELRATFLSPFLRGAQRPPREALPHLRKEAVTTLANRLPQRTVKSWLDALGVVDPMDVHQVDPDRALLALAVVIETDTSGQYDLLATLGYEPSPIELEILGEAS